MWNLNVLLCINITDNDSAACSNSTTIQLPLTTTAVLLLAAPSLQLRKEHDSMGLTQVTATDRFTLCQDSFLHTQTLVIVKAWAAPLAITFQIFEDFLQQLRLCVLTEPTTTSRLCVGINHYYTEGPTVGMQTTLMYYNEKPIIIYYIQEDRQTSKQVICSTYNQSLV